MIDFPANPTVGQQFIAAGVTWVWDGVKWSASGLSIAYVPLAGFVPAMGDNRIINGDCRVDQRWNGASGTANGYTVDRWRYYSSQAAKGTWQQAINQASDIATTGFGYALNFRSSSAYTPLATDYFGFLQAIEADQICDFAWGTASAHPVTLSFWAYCTLTGTFSGAVQNYATTRSYPFTYSIPVANTWTRIAITIPGDTAGTWVLQGNSGSLDLLFDLGGGATYRAPAGAWANGNFLGANGAASLVATNGASLFLTGVKLEIGSVATPYNRQSLAKSMADCQRYYEATAGQQFYSGNMNNANVYVINAYFKVTKRATPTMVVNLGQSLGFPATGVTTVVDVNTVAVQLPANATGVYGYYTMNWNASAEL
jgi:hypothetical protein